MIFPETIHPWIAIIVTLAVFVALQLRRGVNVDLLFLGALIVVVTTGVITPEDAFSGFANPAVLAIAALLAVSAGLRSSGVLDWLGQRLLGSANTEQEAIWRLVPALLSASAFLLNTAVVAMIAPVVVEWCRQKNISPSRLLMPVSYLAILGGVCTLVGTSTTLVANGILKVEHEQRLREAEAPNLDQAERGRRKAFAEQVAPMWLFEIGAAGLPCALIGSGFLLLFGRKLLPVRADMIEQLGQQRREYLVEMLVQPQCPLIGKTVEQAGLRSLHGLFLIEIDRAGDIITPVTPQDVILSGDRLIFTGVVSTIVDLEKIPGLVPAADLTYDFHPDTQHHRHLVEAVLSRTSPLIGTTVREANFRRHYNAAVVAVHRNGARLTNKIGNIQLAPGDTLLLQTRNEFISTFRNSRDFYLVSNVDGAEPRRHHKARLAAILVGVLIFWLISASFLTGSQWAGLASPALAAVAIACLMIVTGCMRASEARNAIDLQMLITIAAALGLGRALVASGAAGSIAEGLISVFGSQPELLLVAVFLLTLALTEMITNNAVAAMLLPVAISVALQGGYSPRPFIMAITLAASLSFITPIGYQTNLMVMGPGGYRPIDYLKCGLPLAVVVSTTALLLIPQIWPL